MSVEAANVVRQVSWDVPSQATHGSFRARTMLFGCHDTLAARSIASKQPWFAYKWDSTEHPKSKSSFRPKTT